MAIWCTGSPPLAWGKVDLFTGDAILRRITPTCVGKSSACAIAPTLSGDHPHLRGEKLIGTAFASKILGSPPLAWGKVVSEILSDMRKRITPTCVGKRFIVAINRKVAGDHPHLRGEKVANVSAERRTEGSPPLAWGKADLYRHC